MCIRDRYWQVYLHKTVVSAECMLINILKRAREIARTDDNLFATPSLRTFLLKDYSIEDFSDDPRLLEAFANLDDSDITTSVKLWRDSADGVLAYLSKCMVNRNLYKIHITNEPISIEMKSKIKKQILERFSILEMDLGYYMIEDTIINNAYNTSVDKINILRKDGSVLDISEAADTLNIKELSAPVEKHFLCYPK